MYNIKIITKEFLNELEDYFSSPDTFMLGINFICKELSLCVIERGVHKEYKMKDLPSVTLTSLFILKDIVTNSERAEINFFLSTFRNELRTLMNNEKNQFTDSIGTIRYKYYYKYNSAIINTIEIIYVYEQN